MTLVTVSSIANQLDNYEPILPIEIPLGEFDEDQYIEVLVNGQVVLTIGETFDRDYYLRLIVYSKDASWQTKVLVEDSLVIAAKNMSTVNWRVGREMENFEVEAYLNQKIELKYKDGDIFFRMPVTSVTGCQLLDCVVLGTDYPAT